MTPETHQQLDSHVRAIAQILYDDAQVNGLPMDSLEDIEHTVRAQLQSHVSPGLGNFLSKQIWLMHAFGDANFATPFGP